MTKKNAKCQFMKSAQTHTCGAFGIPVIRNRNKQMTFMSDDQRLKHSIHSLSEQRKNTVISKQAVLIASKHLVLISILF